MKKLLTVILTIVLLSAAAMPSFAQGRNRRVRTYQAPVSRTYYDYQSRDRSFWEKHRDKVTVAGGAGAGALLGSILGGKKGALIGALAGGGGSALYTYKLRDRQQYYRR